MRNPKPRDLLTVPPQAGVRAGPDPVTDMLELADTASQKPIVTSSENLQAN